MPECMTSDCVFHAEFFLDSHPVGVVFVERPGSAVIFEKDQVFEAFGGNKGAEPGLLLSSVLQSLEAREPWVGEEHRSAFPCFGAGFDN